MHVQVPRRRRRAGASLSGARAGAPPKSTGIVGGTFNPPHLGHLALARHALETVELERVVLMPTHTSPFKSSVPDPGPEQRLHMCGVLVAGEPGLSACSLEIARGGISYTVDTLSAIHASHPDAELTFIVGADTARTLPAWREPSRLLQLAKLAIAQRDGTNRSEVLDSLRSLGASERVSFLSMPIVDVSSSGVRLRASRGEPIDELVGTAVARYIEEQRFYREPDGAAT